jgi:hypothetical protein
VLNREPQIVDISDGLRLSRSLIEKSFRYLVKIPGLGEFWRSILRHYGEDVKLDDDKIRYIIKTRGKGERASDIARNLSVSKRRVEQVYAYYKTHGEIPSLARPGRKSLPISDEERWVILEAHRR